MAVIQTRSVLRCPTCGSETEEEMPLDACLIVYECATCGQVLHPKAGDCCVFCSYGSLPCPSKQEEQAS